MQGLRVQVDAEMALAQKIKVMEILKRAKSGGEIVSFTENDETVNEEVCHREDKAGYRRSSGRIIMKPATERYRKNYRRIFKHD